MRNTLYHRFQFFDINMTFVQLNFLILKWCTTQCSIYTISILKKKNTCCTSWFRNNSRKFANKHILLKQTNWKLNWFNHFSNPLENNSDLFAFQLIFQKSPKHLQIDTVTYFFSYVITPFSVGKLHLYFPGVNFTAAEIKWLNVDWSEIPTAVVFSKKILHALTWKLRKPIVWNLHSVKTNCSTSC